MITVYRIEHQDNGIGIFQNTSDGTYDITKHSNCDNIRDKMGQCPVFWEDRGLKEAYESDNPKDYFFAFNNKVTLRNMLEPEDVLEFQDMGYKVYEIELEIYIKSIYQTVFKKQHIIKKVDVTHLFSN